MWCSSRSTRTDTRTSRWGSLARSASTSVRGSRICGIAGCTAPRYHQPRGVTGAAAPTGIRAGRDVSDPTMAPTVGEPRAIARFGRIGELRRAGEESVAGTRCTDDQLAQRQPLARIADEDRNTPAPAIHAVDRRGSVPAPFSTRLTDLPWKFSSRSPSPAAVAVASRDCGFSRVCRCARYRT